MKINFKNTVFALFLGGITLTSCSEDDLNPILDTEKEVQDPSTAIKSLDDMKNILNGTYNYLSQYEYYGRDIIVLGDVWSDNVYSNANSNRFTVEGTMDLNSEHTIVRELWKNIYGTIATANVAINTSIEGVEGNAADKAEAKHLQGQALVIRALGHFDLVKFYGQQHVTGGGDKGVPYITVFGDEANLSSSRLSVSDLKTKIYEDLNAAKDLLDPAFDTSSKEYVNSYTASAILARVANYFGDQQIAKDAAFDVIQNSGLSIVPATDFVNSWSLKNTNNSIFEIGNRSDDNMGINGIANIYQNTNYGDVVVLEDLVNIYEANDVRGLNHTIELDPNGYYRNTAKYPSIAPYDDNIRVMRYEEIILIYAESILDSNPSDALTYLNMIPQNRDASDYATATIDNILLERRKELAFEGMRFHDLARNQMDIPLVDATKQSHGGPSYGSYNYALPIPNAEISANSGIDQNEGY